MYQVSPLGATTQIQCERIMAIHCVGHLIDPVVVHAEDYLKLATISLGAASNRLMKESPLASQLEEERMDLIC